MENETIDQNTQETKNDNEVLIACQQELAQWKEKCMHVSADLSNYRRRVERDQLLWTALAQTRIVTPLLTIVDNLDRAVAEKPSLDNKHVEAWIEGITMIQNDMHKFLQKFDIKEIPTTGVFNPELHEALMHVSSEQHESGTVVAVLEKGYMMGDTVLRVAKVSVAA